jgi:WD40 repeat protein/tRNA A-37 threonylcarbamoyl transferase component Bud32
MSAANEPPPDLATEQWDRLERAIKRFEEAWQQGRRPALAEYLPAAPDERRVLLVELIHIDLEYRLKAGEAARSESYLQAHPELAQDRAAAVALIAREYELRSRREPGLPVEEYARRFPQYREELALRLKGVTPPPTQPPEGSDETLAEPALAPPAPAPAAPSPAPAGPVGSSANLVQALRSVRLLRGNQLDELDTLQQSFPEPRSLARELLQRNWLTPYQLNQVFQGRERTLVLGPYVLLERLGEGGMGTVFKARHQLMDRVVALKVIRKEQLADEEAVRRFHREIRAAAQLHHPNIVMAYDADHVGDVHFLVMEYVEGTDLGKLVRKEGPLPPEKACDYVRQAALGLQHAHERGMVHRDIKPGNLLLSKAGVVKILDMGLARLSQGAGDQTVAGDLTREGSVMGTPDYIAPEQAEESHTVDIRADIYSLGCALYHLLTRSVPFPGGSLAQKLIKHRYHEPAALEAVRPGLPAGLDAVVRRMMAKEPGQRYQTPAEVAAALEPFCHPHPAATPLPGAAPAPSAPAVAPAAAADEQTLTMPPMQAGPSSVSLRALWENRRVRRILIGVAAALAVLVVAVWLLRPSPAVPHHPLDRLAWENIPAGDRFSWQPNGLVAVLGEHRVRARSGNAFTRVAVSADGKRGAVAGTNGEICLFDSETLRERRVPKRHEGGVHAVAFSPDGQTLASGGEDQVVVLWDVAAGEVRKRCRKHTGRVTDLAFSPDGKWLASGSLDKKVCLWDAKDGTLVGVFTGHRAPVLCVAFSSNSRRVFSGGGEINPKGKPVDCVIRQWEIGKPKEVGRFAKGLQKPVTSLAVSRDGQWLLSGGEDGLRLWGLDEDKETHALLATQAERVAFSPDGHFALSGSMSGNQWIRVWDVATRRAIREVQILTPGLAFLPDNRRLVAIQGETLRMWDTEDGKELCRVVGHTAAVTALTFSEDGLSLLSGGRDKLVYLWDLERLHEPRAFPGHTRELVSVALAPSGRHAASCSDGGTPDEQSVRLWDVQSARELRKFPGLVGGAPAVAFSPDEQYVLAAAEPVKDKDKKPEDNHAFALWDVDSGKQVRRFSGHTSHVYQLGFLLGGQQVFSRGNDGTVRLWDVETGKELQKFSWSATCVAFAEDGALAYTGHGDGTVQRWDLTRTPPDPFAFKRYHTAAVRALALAPDGLTLASVDNDGRVIVWDATSRAKLREWTQPEGVNALAFAPDGRHLATANGNNTIYIIRLE